MGKKKRTRARKAPPELVSPATYAGARGLSRQAVMRAIESGRLTEASVSRTDRGWWRIDAAKADKEWASNTDGRKQREEKAGGRESRAEKTPTLPGLGLDPEHRGAKVTLAKASAEKVNVQAQLAHLSLREKLGELVDAGAIRREYFKLARRVRDRLLGIPDRVAAIVAAEGDQRKVHQLLVGAIAEALAELVEEGGEP